MKTFIKICILWVLGIGISAWAWSQDRSYIPSPDLTKNQGQMVWCETCGTWVSHNIYAPMKPPFEDSVTQQTVQPGLAPAANP